MDSSVSSLSLELAGELDDLGLINSRVPPFLGAAGVHEEVCSQVLLVIEELLVNTIHYGLGECDDAEVRLELNLMPGRVEAVLEDNGKAFDPWREAPAPVLEGEPKERPVGGLGLFIVQNMVAQRSYDRRDARNRTGFAINLR